MTLYSINADDAPMLVEVLVLTETKLAYRVPHPYYTRGKLVRLKHAGKPWSTYFATPGAAWAAYRVSLIAAMADAERKLARAKKNLAAVPVTEEEERG